METYNQTQFNPPAPFAYVAVSVPGNDAPAGNVPLLVDTGADMTLIPRSAISQLEWIDSVVGQLELESFDGSLIKVPVVQVEIKIFGKVFRGRYALVEQNYGVLGRDILNLMNLVFNGPTLTWGEAKRR